MFLCNIMISAFNVYFNLVNAIFFTSWLFVMATLSYEQSLHFLPHELVNADGCQFYTLCTNCGYYLQASKEDDVIAENHLFTETAPINKKQE